MVKRQKGSGARVGSGERAAVLGVVLAAALLAGCGRKDAATAQPAIPAGRTVPASPVLPAERSAETAKQPRVAEWNRLLAVSRRRPEAGTETAIRNFFGDWAAEDETAARAAAAGLTDFAERLAAHEGLLAEGLAKDPKSAVEWLRGVEPKALAEVLLDQALADWAGVDAAGAGKYVAGLGTSDYRTVLAGELARAWAAKDGAGAMAWGAGLQDQEAREEALTEAVHTVAATDVRAAAQMTLKIKHATARDDALELAVIAWWEREPSAVAAWAERIPDVELRAQAQRVVAAQREAAGR